MMNAACKVAMKRLSAQWRRTAYFGTFLYAIVLSGSVFGMDCYVATNGNHISPYENWDKAATNIQDAVNAAGAGGTVWISNGTYRVTSSSARLVSITNSLSLRGFSGNPADVLIDGNGPACTNRGIYVALTNPASVLIDALTISNFYASGSGGGILIKITNLVSGAEVSGTAVVQNCVLTDNKCFRAGTTFRGWGAGLCAFGQVGSEFYTVVSNCTIINNITTNSGNGNAGGGALFYMSRFTMQDCRVAGNVSTYDGGGGICVFQDNLTIPGSVIKSCLIESNTTLTTAYGAGVRVANGTLIENCTIRYNRVIGTAGGGGVYLGAGQTNTLRNCLVCYNTANMGAGVFAPVSTNLIENCTIASNVNNSTENGAGIWMGSAGSQLDMRNTILYDNYKTNGALYNFYLVNYIRSAANCCTMPTNGIAGAGNFTNAPRFVNFAGGDFRLASDSPCINRGLNQSWMSGALDLDKHARMDIFSGIADIGCYEYVPGGTLFMVR